MKTIPGQPELFGGFQNKQQKLLEAWVSEYEHCCLSRRLRLDSEKPHGSAELSVSTVPGILHPLLTSVSTACKWCIYVHAGKYAYT